MGRPAAAAILDAKYAPLHEGDFKMSLFDTFDPVSEEILKPSHMIRPVDGFPETAVLDRKSVV